MDWSTAAATLRYLDFTGSPFPGKFRLRIHEATMGKRANWETLGKRSFTLRSYADAERKLRQYLEPYGEPNWSYGLFDRKPYDLAGVATQIDGESDGSATRRTVAWKLERVG